MFELHELSTHENSAMCRMLAQMSQIRDKKNLEGHKKQHILETHSVEIGWWSSTFTSGPVVRTAIGEELTFEQRDQYDQSMIRVKGATKHQVKPLREVKYLICWMHQFMILFEKHITMHIK